MPDYELKRLNTRSFEQLIQALGIAILGKQLMVFGDGPDGGREATFEGPVNYPNGEKAWNGYGIVQAKFRQKPDSEAKKNADWALEQLRSEFKNFEPRPKTKKSSRPGERICPEFYIFATNLALSPVARRGGKDRVRTALDGFKKSHGLKDYAIWDEDQIRRFLDGQPEIRTTYLAWLLPGDVLAEMMKFLRLEQTDFPSTIKRCLQSELLDDQFPRLSQGGYTDAKNIPLSAVFIDLPVEVTNAGPATLLDFFFEEGGQNLRPSARLSQCGDHAGRRQAGRMVLIGGPGQGKTTVGQFACQLLRTELLRATGGPFSPEVTQALERIEKMSDGLPKVHARRYPLRVDLKHLGTELAGQGDYPSKSLFDYLVRRISHHSNSTLKAEHFRQWLRVYPWVLVLDGLDEVPASSNRQQVIRAIRDFISIEAHDVDSDLLVLATTRPQGYSDEFDPSFYRHLHLAPLNPDQALEYGLRLVSARHPAQPTRVDELTDSLKRATNNPATVHLMQSPLQVVIMLVLIEGGGEPPQHRWKLFRDYYEAIYRREKERATPFSSILISYEPDIHWIHHRVGWVLQQRNAAVGGTDSRLSHSEFDKIVNNRLEERGHEDVQGRAELVIDIRKAAMDRLVLLVGNTENEIGFEIRSFQEFMAAEHFFDGGESCVVRTLHTIAPYPYWQNVLLFVAGRIFFERQVLIDLLIAVCAKLNDLPDDVAQVAIHAGSRLALALLKDGAAQHQPGSLRVLARCAARALDTWDYKVGRLFAELFSGDVETVWKEELSRRLTSSGLRFPDQDWYICLKLVMSGNPWAQKLMIDHFPWASEDAGRFFIGLVRIPDSIPDTFIERFVQDAWRHPPSIYFRIHHYKNAVFKALPTPILESIRFSQQISHIGVSPQPYCRVVDHSRNPIGIGFYVQGEDKLREWATLRFSEEALANAHPGWLIINTISRFARKPDKVGLVNQLKLIDGIDLGSLEPPHWVPCWQLAACLAARRAGHSWRDIIARVAQGAIGDADDWKRWRETRKMGITISQCREGSEWLSVSNDAQGLLCENAIWGWASNSDSKVLHLVNEVSDALNQWPKSENRLVQFAGFSLLALASSLGANSPASVVRFLDSWKNSTIPISTSILPALILCPAPVMQGLRMLAEAGLCSLERTSGWYVVDDWRKLTSALEIRLSTLLAELPSSPNWQEILRAISYLPPLDALENIPDALLNKYCFKEERLAKATSVIRLNSLRWTSADVQEVAREALALQTDYPGQLNDLFRFIDEKGKHGLHLELFLSELLKEVPAAVEVTLLQDITTLLVKLVERRPTNVSLPDPVECVSSSVSASELMK